MTKIDHQLPLKDKAEPVVVWSDLLLTGLEDVDAQHHKLIDLINRLGKLQTGSSTPEEIIVVFGELKNYTLMHFKHEEELMDAWPVNAANKTAHFKAHQDFAERIEKINALINSHPSFAVDHLLAFLVKWLVRHIADVDSRMAAEIITLRSGHTPAPKPGTNGNDYNNTISELYDSIGLHSLEIIDLNIQLHGEIARRKKTQDEAQLATLVFHNSSDAMTVTDAETRIIAVNPAFTQLTGYLPEDVIGENPSILSSGQHDEAFYADMWKSIVDNGHWEGELWNRHKDGKVFAESLAINTIYHPDGSVDRRIAVFSDITDKKLSEEKIAQQATELKVLHDKQTELNASLLQEIAVKNRLFSIISHDLRSPFTILLGLSEKMAKQTGSMSKEKIAQQVAIINKVAKNTFATLEDLLEWSFLQLDGEKIDSRNIDIKEIVEDTLQIHQPAAQVKKITLRSNIGNLRVYADYNYVVTVLRNLVSNAIKFTHQGGNVEVTVNTNGHMVEIGVVDNGTGIPEQIQDKLFAVDQKTSTPGTQGELGSGLGLPLCADLIAKMGGGITVDDSHRPGARLVFTLPVAHTTK